MENLNELIKKLINADDSYYNKSKSIMTDEEYDNLKRKVEELDPENSYLGYVGANVEKSHLEISEHLMKMGSLNNVANINEFITWSNKYPHDYIVSEKLDGSSVELWYRNGYFQKAVTRGDGFKGEVVTKNYVKFSNSVLYMGVPDFTGAIRGEVILEKYTFDKYFEGYSNPRNAANGAVRNSDSSMAHHLKFVAFDIESLYDFNFDCFTDKINFLRNCGFETVKNYFVTNDRMMIQNISSIYNSYIDHIRDSINYEIDGLVVRINNEDEFEEYGFKNNRPKAGIAFKFPSMSATTILNDVVFSIGSSGMIAPTGILKPVQIGGVVVSNVYLNNMEEIEKLNISIGDEVKIIRAGDVIPKCTGVVNKGENRQKINMLSNCIHCNGKIEKIGANHFCTNKDCAGINDSKLKSWINKRDIKYIGESTRKQFSKDGYTKIQDLYTMSDEYFNSINNGHNIKKEIEKSRKCKLEDLFGSLSIKFLGKRKVLQMIEAGFDNYDKIININTDELSKHEGFGYVMAKEICDGIKENIDLISFLKNQLDIIEPEIKSGNLSGKSFCFTGKINIDNPNYSSMNRKQLSEIVINNGGEVKNSVSKNLDYLVQDDPNSNSSKSKKARQNDVKIIDYNEFISMID